MLSFQATSLVIRTAVCELQVHYGTISSNLIKQFLIIVKGETKKKEGADLSRRVVLKLKL